IRVDVCLSTVHNQLIKVRRTGSDEHELWARTAAEGWNEFGEFTDFMHELGVMNAKRSSLSFLAELDGKAIATGAMSICDGVALLAGGRTVVRGAYAGSRMLALKLR